MPRSRSHQASTTSRSTGLPALWGSAPVADFVIGPGVQQAMADNGDEPRSDEQYKILVDGHRISETYGRDAVYTWLEEDNAVRRQPFR